MKIKGAKLDHIDLETVRKASVETIQLSSVDGLCTGEKQWLALAGFLQEELLPVMGSLFPGVTRESIAVELHPGDTLYVDVQVNNSCNYVRAFLPEDIMRLYDPYETDTAETSLRRFAKNIAAVMDKYISSKLNRKVTA